MNEIKEGDLYAVLEIHGHRIELRYGYYEEHERARGEPIPIYPDLKKHPIYTNEGYPIVTQMQELCEQGDSPYEDGCCFDCQFFKKEYDLFGICKNTKNRKKQYMRKDNKQ